MGAPQMRACIFAGAGPGEPEGGALGHRVGQLVAYYAPLGATPRWWALHRVGEDAWLGWIAFDEATHETLLVSWRERGSVWRGERPPAPLATGAALAAAGDVELRSLAGSTAVFAATEQGLTVATGASPPASLYGCEARGLRVCATHAVAAGWLATGTVELRPDALGELVALEFVGGGHTLLDGVRRMPLAARVTLGSARGERTSWSAVDRWRPLPASEAQAEGEAALLRTLSARVAGERAPRLGLTGGLDSLVVAVALREIGAEVGAFTWDHAPTDVRAAQRVAGRLGLSHESVPTRWSRPGEWAPKLDAEVRWSEGTASATGRAEVSFPAPMTAFVTGAGGETGRAFYYGWLAAGCAEPSPRQILSLWRPEHRLRKAPRAVREALRARVAEWLGEAERHGLRGWGLLDALYAEQRVMDWGRSMVIAPVPTIAALAHPEVSAALASLPLAERLTDGFHRRFVARYAPEVAVPPPPRRQRRGIPRPARRLMTRVRGLRWERPVEGPAAIEDTDRTTWLVEEVLAAPLVHAGLGRRWADATRAGLIVGDREHLQAAIRVSGPVALESSFRDLRGG